jgi:high-affinity nickel-transport protein
MTLVDSLDSILMPYASPSRSTPEGQMSFFQDEKKAEAIPILSGQPEDEEQEQTATGLTAGIPQLPIGQTSDLETGIERIIETDPTIDIKSLPQNASLADEETEARRTVVPIDSQDSHAQEVTTRDDRARRLMDSKANVMSSLSITLTILSILVALR